MNISMKLVDELKIRPRRTNELLGVCPVCFDSSVKVQTTLGLKNINKVAIGDTVLSEGGNFERVLDILSRDYSGSLVKIHGNGIEDILVTPSHTFYVIKPKFVKNKQFNSGIRRIRYNAKCSLVKIKAEDIDTDCYLVYPIWSNSNRKETISPCEYIPKKRWAVVLPRQILLDNDFLAVVGLYIAEGSSKDRELCFSLHIKETCYANIIERYFTRFGIKCRRYIRGNSMTVWVSSMHFSKWFSSWIGVGSHNKHIPWELQNLELKKATTLFNYIIFGDGNLGHRKTFSIGQTSETLAYQLVNLALNIGYTAGISVDCPKGKKKVFKSYFTMNKRNSTYKNFGWYKLVKVTGITNVPSGGRVFNLTVENTHKYVANGVLVDNCNCRDANFNTSKLLWHCWHCGGKGHITPEDGYVIKEEEEPVLDIPEVRKLYTSLAQKYHTSITQPVMEYLKSRGLTQQTIDNFCLGFCSTDFYDEYSNKLAEEAGLLWQNYPVLTNRITIPYTANSEVTDLRGRIVSDVFTYKADTPTYSSLSGNHQTRGATFPFNYDIIGKNNQIILTEGEFKAIVGYQHGFPIVAMPGIFGWQREWAKLFVGKEIILAADSDVIRGSKSPSYLMAKVIKKDVPKFKVAVLRWVNWKTKEDIDSMIINSGVKSFERAIKGAIDVDLYLEQEDRRGYGRRK